jgi:hypothetical protein
VEARLLLRDGDLLVCAGRQFNSAISGKHDSTGGVDRAVATLGGSAMIGVIDAVAPRAIGLAAHINEG